MEKLTKYEKIIARRLGVSSKDVHFIRHNCYGTAYGLYNDYYYIAKTFFGYTKAEIYRILLRDLIEKIGILNQA